MIRLILDRNRPGSTIEDITIFQMGADPDAKLYLKAIGILTWPSARGAP